MHDPMNLTPHARRRLVDRMADRHVPLTVARHLGTASPDALPLSRLAPEVGLETLTPSGFDVRGTRLRLWTAAVLPDLLSPRFAGAQRSPAQGAEAHAPDRRLMWPVDRRDGIAVLDVPSWTWVARRVEWIWARNRRMGQGPLVRAVAEHGADMLGELLVAPLWLRAGSDEDRLCFTALNGSRRLGACAELQGLNADAHVALASDEERLRRHVGALRAHPEKLDPAVAASATVRAQLALEPASWSQLQDWGYWEHGGAYEPQPFVARARS